jgi:hypothetical protein
MGMQIVESTSAPKPKIKAYQITYRIDGQDTEQGTRQQRYDALTALLDDLPAVVRRGHFTDDAHISTSSWLVRTRDPDPDALGCKLARVLTKGVDLLEVMQVDAAGRYELTVVAPKPKSTKR